ncbi:MAG: H-NS histone family protein [Hasllibacter sp.]
MAKKLENMDKDELRAELKERKKKVDEVEKALREYDDRAKNEARAALEKQAADMGFSLDELMGGGKKRRGSASSGAKGEPKYRDPQSGKTWTGKGRQPAWFKDHVSTGGDPQELAV